MATVGPPVLMILVHEMEMEDMTATLVKQKAKLCPMQDNAHRAATGYFHVSE